MDEKYLLCMAEESVYRRMPNNYTHTKGEIPFKQVAYVELEPSFLENITEDSVEKCSRCYVSTNFKCPLE